MLSCLMDAWMSVEHFPYARKPTVLQLVCQHILALHGITSQPTLCVGSSCWSSLIDDGLRASTAALLLPGSPRLLPAVYCGSSAAVRTVASEAYNRTRVLLVASQCVASELVNLVPVFQCTHVALQT